MSKQALSSGVFVLSLDTELAWGTRGDRRYLEDYNQTREVIDSLLSLLVKYNLSATWATVGHLFLDTCQDVSGKKHPNLLRPSYPDVSEDWFGIDPATSRDQDPFWYGKDILDAISRCHVSQEIGSHNFSHVVVDERYCPKEVFASELEEARRVAGGLGIDLKSFVYPKNVIGHVNALREAGFTSYRGRDPVWYKKLPGMLAKLGHVIDNYVGVTPPTVVPAHEDGLWNIPGSYFFPHARGWARMLPGVLRKRKALAGIHRAIERKEVFHLWFHPFNLASDPEKLLGILEDVFAYVRECIDAGVLENKAMGQLTLELNDTI